MRRGRRGVQRVGVTEPLLLGQQRGVLARDRRHPLDLVQRAPQVFRLGRPFPRPRGQLGQLGLHLPVPGVGALVVGHDGGQGRAGELVQRLPLLGGAQQLLLVGLAVHGHQVIGQADQQRHGHRAAAGVRPGPAFGRHRAAHDQGAAVVVQLAPGVKHLLRGGPVRLDPQPPFDGGPVRAGPDPCRVGPAAEHQAEAGHDHGLAGPGLAGHHGEPGRELKDGILDHPKAGDPDFLKHRRGAPLSRLVLRPGPSARASRPPGGRTWPPAGR